MVAQKFWSRLKDNDKVVSTEAIRIFNESSSVDEFLKNMKPGSLEIPNYTLNSLMSVYNLGKHKRSDGQRRKFAENIYSHRKFFKIRKSYPTSTKEINYSKERNL